MSNLMKLFWDICRLKTGPQTLPKGSYLLGAAVIAAIIVDSFSSSILIPGMTGIDIVVIVAGYNIILLFAVSLILKIIGYQARIIQTLTAIAGSGLIISLVLLPGLIMTDLLQEQVKSFAIFILLDNIWRIAVDAHIFRHALGIGMLMAMILSVSYLLFGMLVAEYLLPAQS